VKKIRVHPNVADEVRAVERRAALNILSSIHRYAATGTGNVRALSGAFEGLFRLRVGDHCVIFEENGTTITVHHILHRKDAYR